MIIFYQSLSCAFEFLVLVFATGNNQPQGRNRNWWLQVPLRVIQPHSFCFLITLQESFHPPFTAINQIFSLPFPLVFATLLDVEIVMIHRSWDLLKGKTVFDMVIKALQRKAFSLQCKYNIRVFFVIPI